MNELAQARQLIWDTLEADAGFKLGYVSNLAMLLHDELYGLDYDKRNDLAEKILQKIFK